MRSGASRFGFYCRCAIVRLAIFIDFAVRDGSESQKTLFTFGPDAPSTIELLIESCDSSMQPVKIHKALVEISLAFLKSRGIT
ncbi:hypothetical protein QUB36_27710 [Microcoleus sp. AT8-B1]|uniref:hypothetical protein n=1 Tax=unclassified Microcoleus TaxID=2642155 RepID=UPI002FD44A40